MNLDYGTLLNTKNEDILISESFGKKMIRIMWIA